MSETEKHKGKLIPLEFEGTTEEQAKQACEYMGFEKRDYHEDWLDCFKDEGYRIAHFFNDKFYRIDDEELDPYDGYANASMNEDGTIDYELQYYNGGASFTEVLDDAMENIK